MIRMSDMEITRKSKRELCCAAVVLFFRYGWSAERIAQKFNWNVEDVETFTEAALDLFPADRKQV